MDRVCELPDCDRGVFSRQWCQKHYTRWLRHGDPDHQRKLGRYKYVTSHGHPVANTMGVVAEHRFVAWEAGLLHEGNKQDHVHHINGDKHDNRIENLEVLDAASHAREHIKRRPDEFTCGRGHDLRIVGKPDKRRGYLRCRECARIAERLRAERRVVPD